MRITYAPLIASVIAALATHAFAALSYTNSANAMVLALLKENSNPSQEEVVEFLKEKNLHKSKGFSAAFNQSLSVAKELLADNIELSNELFPELLASNTGADVRPNTDVQSQRSDTNTGSAEKPKLSHEQTRGRAIAKGLASLEGATRAELNYEAYVHNISPANNSSSIANAPKLRDGESVGSVIKGITDNPATLESIETKSTQTFGNDLTAVALKVGQKEIAVDEAAAKRAADVLEAAEKKKATADKVATENEPQVASDSTVEGSETIDKDLKITPTVLRRLGLSTGAGYGVIHTDTATSPIQSIILRWNLFQRSATLRWNAQQVANGNPEKQIEFGWAGHKGRRLIKGKFGLKKGSYEDIARLFKPRLYMPNSFGPFFGSAFGGNTVDLGVKKDGEPVLERPYLAGVHFGFYPYEQGSSLIYIDLGTTISPKNGFRHTRPYVGISADGVVLLKLFDGIRSFTVTDPGK